jgi:hypothetical protein
MNNENVKILKLQCLSVCLTNRAGQGQGWAGRHFQLLAVIFLAVIFLALIF